MGWAAEYIEQLKRGEQVKFRPRGNSMQGKIESGQLVTVNPIRSEKVAHHSEMVQEDVPVGSIVLCKVEGREWLHLVTAVGSDGRYQISNNKGHVNGWCRPENVYGVVEKVED